MTIEAWLEVARLSLLIFFLTVKIFECQFLEKCRGTDYLFTVISIYFHSNYLNVENEIISSNLRLLSVLTGSYTITLVLVKPF